ncbi:MAG: hydantoinase/oxoprolinase family protein [Planctomycetes bacterium]|nr:hydantoinase/oxoprolinase family protein [Planctomycetota bacterium]
MPTIAAIDVGGTFTDACLLKNGQVLTCKVPSTPDDPSIAVINALQKLGGADTLIHGTTVATNALLEGKLARTAIICTKGLKDVLAIGRQNRAAEDLYSLQPSQRNPLIPAELRLEVAERIGPDGEIELKLTRQELERVTAEIAELKPEAIAVCLLHSYANDKHERMLGKALRKLKLPVVLSSELAPEFREYERSLVTAANAGLIPLLQRYIHRIEHAIKPTSLLLMQSAGGWLPAKIAAQEPVKLALSGPAGGIAGVRQALDLDDFDEGVAFDIGGTSTDVSLIRKHAHVRAETPIAGLPLRTPSLDIHTIGAGGGSIAWLDAGGALRVGPQSAGANPGPACYGHGGEQPTLTDALVQLGRLPADLKLGGEITLQPKEAAKVLKKIDKNPTKAAKAVLQVALAGIERALRKVTVERGLSTHDKPLVPFGGAGGLLACDLAELMGMKTVLIPHSPGLLCALGMLHTPASRDLSHTVLLAGNGDGYNVALDVSRQLAEQAEFDLRDGGVKGRFKTARSIDVRYEGQSFDLNVPLTKHWRKNFEEAHNRVYETESRDDAECEIVAVRVRVESGTRAEKALSWKSPDKKGKPVSISNGVSVYERESLRAGQKIEGPAIVTELSTCVFVKNNWVLIVAASGQLVLTSQGGIDA